MAHLVEIAFKGNRKEFFLWDGDDPPRVRTVVIVEGDRGEDLGEVHAIGELAAKRWAGVAHGEVMLGPGAQPARRALRLAVPEEVRRAEELDALNEDARRKSMERVRAHNLVMKISDADWQWDRRKLTLYFTAEKRVDFRALVRDLAALFRTRIELKQIGVRDEAKRLDGVGRCGRQYCSAAWLPELRPVNLSVAKDQRLSLNPTQISGACGRLMCSLRYEHDFYVQQRKRFPKEGKILATSKGEEKVVANDIFRERVTLRAFDGEVRMVPLADLRHEMEGLGGPFAPASTEDTDTYDIAELSDAVLDADAAPRRSARPDPREVRDARNSRIAGERREPVERRAGDRRESERREPAPPADERVDVTTGALPMPAASLPVLPDASADAAAGTAEPEIAAEGVVLPAADGATGGEPAEGDEPRPRRRRGRRGGRRNRANRQAGDATGAAGGEADDPDGDDGAGDGSDDEPA